MQGADQGQSAPLEGDGLSIGIVRARFNDTITRSLADACLAELAALGVSDKHIVQVTVPGALEVPVALKAMADSEDFDALIAIGCIIRGETYHFELVANETSARRAAASTAVPCACLRAPSPNRATATAPGAGSHRRR